MYRLPIPRFRRLLVTLGLFGCMTGVFALVAERLVLVDIVFGYYALALVVGLLLSRRAAVLVLILAPAGVAILALTNRTGVHLTDTGVSVRVALLAALASSTVFAMMRRVADAGEYRRVEGALRTSEDRFRYLFERNPLPMWITDLETSAFLEVNEAAVLKYGYAREHFLAMRARDIRRPEDVPLLEERLAAAREAHPEGVWQQSDGWRLVLADRSVIDAEIASAVITFEGRRALLIVASDVTARNSAFEELGESRRFLSTLVSNLPGYAYRCKNDAEHTLEFISDGVTFLTGYPADDFVTRRAISLHEIIHPADFQFLHAAMDEGLRTHRAWDATYRLRTQNGEDRWVHEQGRGVYGSDGALLAREGFVTDITEQHRAEDDLRESERRLRTIIEHAPEAMVIFDVELGRFADVNENAVELFGYARETLLRMDPAALSAPAQPDGRPSVEFGMAFVREAVAGLSPVFEWTHRNAAGQDIPCEVRLVQLPSTERTLVRASITDIRVRKRLEEQFLQAQKMESIGRLAGGVAHDFNNLMTAAIGYADLALASLPLDDPASADVREIRETAARAADLSHQLLAFSRRQLIEPRVVSLNELVLRTDRILRRLIGEDIDLVTSTAPDLGLVMIDPGQFEQVLINLAVNARDALPTGGEISIQTSNVDLVEDEGEAAGMKPGAYVMLAVSDSGTGISNEVQAHLFEPFFTTKAPGKGTGLGLATCYGVVKQAGGDIQVESAPGRGSTFRILLPRVNQLLPAEDTRGGWDMPHGSETVLVVEDERAVRDLAARVLRELGYTVIEAANGDQALEAAARHGGCIDLLLTDVVMPQMGGTELAEKFHAVRPGAQVLFTSGYTADAEVRDSILERAIAFLPKPFSPLTLARKVRDVLDDSRADISSREANH